MRALVRIVVSVLTIMLLTGPPCYALSVAGQNTARGVDYASQGKLKEAEQEFEQALKVDPAFGPAKRALQIIEDVASQKIQSQSAVNYFKGIVHSMQGQHEQAIPYYSKAIEMDPGFANAYFSRGVAYAQGRHQFDQAISDYDKAIELNPDFAKAILSRGAAYYFTGDYDKAWADVHKAQSMSLQVHPEFLQALRQASGRQQ